MLIILKKKYDKNITTSICSDDEVFALLNEHFHVDELIRVEWIIDTSTSYHATSDLELFSNYKVREFDTIKIEN